jgi:hypothetical protein
MADVLFEQEELLTEAENETGLSNFGPEHFHEGLGVLIESLTNDSTLKPEAVARARAMMVTQLKKRLAVQDWYDRHPEILDQAITAPIFILGSPRSGSSIMHEILSLDPAVRTPQSWEVNNPVPPPEEATYETDPRIAEMQARYDASAASTPHRKMHRVGAQLPAEDVEITQLDFASVIPIVSFYVPTYSYWLYNEVDYRPVYETLRRFMQLLQWKVPRSPWILKSLYSMHYIDAFLDAFPDGRVIWMHRDPLDAMASGVKLVQLAARPSTDTVTNEQLAADIARASVWQHERSVDVQERGMIPPERLINVKFRDFVQDHVTTVARIYDHFGMELRPEVEKTMREYVGGNPAERHSRYEEDLAAVGIDAAEYRRTFARYQQYFDIPNE